MVKVLGQGLKSEDDKFRYGYSRLIGKWMWSYSTVTKSGPELETVNK